MHTFNSQFDVTLGEWNKAREFGKMKKLIYSVTTRSTFNKASTTPQQLMHKLSV